MKFFTTTVSIVALFLAVQGTQGLGFGSNVAVKDKMRSCLDASGNRVVRDYDANLDDCSYTNDDAGRFFSNCEVTFAEGVDTENVEDRDMIVPAVCGSANLDRDCANQDVTDWFKAIFIVIDQNFCEVADDYQQTLTQNDGDTCTCKETYSTCPLTGNCGLIEPVNKGDSGRTGCNIEACQKVVCDWDSFCCGEFNGFWDRICIAYAGQQEECCRSDCIFGQDIICPTSWCGILGRFLGLCGIWDGVPQFIDGIIASILGIFGL